MKKVKRVLMILAVGIMFAMIGIAGVTCIAGALQWGINIINDETPSVIEWICVLGIAFICGSAGAIWYYIDMDD